MKKTVTKEVTICDHCGKETYVDTCLHCGLEHCYKCRETEGTVYSYGVFIHGSGDGYYCGKCDRELSLGNNKLYWAYRKIHQLSDEMVGWNARFTRRKEEAEKWLGKLQEENYG